MLLCVRRHLLEQRVQRSQLSPGEGRAYVVVGGVVTLRWRPRHASPRATYDGSSGVTRPTSPSSPGRCERLLGREPRLVALGLVALGLVALGLVALGLVALGLVALGLGLLGLDVLGQGAE